MRRRQVRRGLNPPTFARSNNSALTSTTIRLIEQTIGLNPSLLSHSIATGARATPLPPVLTRPRALHLGKGG